MSINMIKTPMADLQKSAKFSLAKHGVESDGKGGIKVRLVLDHSGSMMGWYQAGAVQRLTEQVLGLSAALDDDGLTEGWYFGTDVSNVYPISLNPTYPINDQTARRRESRQLSSAVQTDPYYVGWVDRSHSQVPWGWTNYPAGLKAPVDFQRNSDEEEPALVIFQTDGAPDDAEAARRMLRQYSGDRTFFAFVVFGEEKNWDGSFTPVGKFMDSLNNMPGRVRDNASAFFTGGLDKYATLPDSAVYDGVLGEFVSQWLPKVL
jgi:hypothetical protein